MTIQDNAGNSLSITLDGTFTIADGGTTAQGNFTINSGTGAFIGATGQGSFNETLAGVGSSPWLSLTGTWLGITGYPMGQAQASVTYYVPPPYMYVYPYPYSYSFGWPYYVPMPDQPPANVQGVNQATGQPFAVGTAPQANPAILVAPLVTATPVVSTNAATGAQMSIGTAPSLYPAAAVGTNAPSIVVIYSNPPTTTDATGAPTMTVGTAPSLPPAAPTPSPSTTTSTGPSAPASPGTSTGSSTYTPPPTTNYSNPTLPSNNPSDNTTIRDAIQK